MIGRLTLIAGDKAGKEDNFRGLTIFNNRAAMVSRLLDGGYAIARGGDPELCRVVLGLVRRGPDNRGKRGSRRSWQVILYQYESELTVLTCRYRL